MGVGRNKIFKIDPYELTEWEDWEVSEIQTSAVFSSYDWSDKLPSIDDLERLPVFWNKEQAAASLAASAVDPDNPFIEPLLIPSNYFGKIKSLIREPKAIIYSIYSDGTGLAAGKDFTIKAAIEELAEDLDEANIFAGPAAAVSDGNGSLPCGLPWSSVDFVFDFFPSGGNEHPFAAKFFEDNTCSGGEILYLNVFDPGGPGGGPYFYSDIDVWGEMPNAQQADFEYLKAIYPRHKKVKFYSVFGYDNTYFPSMDIPDGDKCIEKIEELNSAWGSFGVQFETVTGIFTGGVHEAAKTALVGIIRDFFEL